MARALFLKMRVRHRALRRQECDRVIIGRAGRAMIWWGLVSRLSITGLWMRGIKGCRWGHSGNAWGWRTALPQMGALLAECLIFMFKLRNSVVCWP